MGAVVPIISAIATIGGTVGGFVMQSQAQKRQQQAADKAEEAAKQQAEAERIRNEQARREAIRRRAFALKEARLGRGTVRAAAGTTGISGTPVSGAISGITGQVASNVSFANQQFQLEQQRQGFLQNAIGLGNQSAALSSQAQILGARGSQFQSLGAGFSSGLESLSRIF